MTISVACTERFRTVFESLGGKMYLSEHRESLESLLADIIIKEQAKRAVLWNHKALIEVCSKVNLLLPELQLAVESKEMSKSEWIGEADRADVGITWGDCAVAETGSLVLLSRTGQSRIVSLLPPVHIAIMPINRLFETRAEMFSAFKEQWRQVTSVTLVSGPSKTGDIDGSIRKGVHGPKKVYAILCEE